MIDDFETQLEERKQEYQEELIIIEKRIDNHIDKQGNNILDRFPYWIELPTPLINYYVKDDNFLRWLEENVDAHDYLRPWPHLVYFKNSEDAVAFKLRWI